MLAFSFHTRKEHLLWCHTILWMIGYGAAGYALFVAVYAGLEVSIWPFFLKFDILS